MSSVAHLRGRVSGALILTCFGTVWCVLALLFWPARPAWSIPAASIAAAALIALAIHRLWLLKNIPSMDDPVAAAKGKRDGMWFGIIFGGEGFLIWLAVNILQNLHRSEWIPLAAGAIVGLHFLPLARLFQASIYYWTGSLSVFAMILCAFIPNADTRVLYAALSMAAILWLTALTVLLRIPAMMQPS